MNEENLKQRLDLMRRDSQLPRGVIDAFGEWVRHAPDEELFRVDVLAWAEQHAASQTEALDLFLHAAARGIFELAWGVLCPSCGMLIHTPGGLRALGPSPHCRLCRTDFPAAVDDQIEVTFSVEPGIRRLRFYEPDGIDLSRDADRLFFGPTHEPTSAVGSISHRLRAAQGVASGATVELTATLEPGYGVVIAPGVHALAFVGIAPGQTATKADFEIHDGAMLPAEIGVAPGPVRFRVTNRTHHALIACLAQLPSREDGMPTFRVRPFVTGKRVLTSQTFRDLFRTETIGEAGLSIKSLTLLFTDLQASTAMYERVGDLRALELVRAHFDQLARVIAAERGSVVKTIGDAVMAAFIEPERALAAAAGMIRAMGNIDGAGEDLVLKIGIHAGSCIAIQSNHQMDYFGSTVNTAARVQGLAAGSEIVVTDPVWDAPGVRALAERLGLVARPDRATLRGIAAPVAVQRLRLAEPSR